MQAINNDVALSVHAPIVPVESANDALAKNVQIADVLAQINQRQAESADFASKAPLRAAQTANQMQALAEKRLTDQSLDAASELGDDGHVRVNPSKLESALTAGQVPGIGSGGYLIPKAKAQVSDYESAAQQALIDHATNSNKLLALEALPMKNFQASGKTPADWQALKDNINRIDPIYAKTFGPEYIPETHDPIMNRIIAQHKQQEDTAEQLISAQKEEQLRLMTPEGKQAKLDELNTAAAKEDGVTVDKLDQETKDANYERVYGTKIVRKAAARSQVLGTTPGDAVPEGGLDENGQPVVDRKPGTTYNIVQNPADKSIRYVRKTYTPSKSSFLLQAMSETDPAKREAAISQVRKMYSSGTDVSGLTTDAIDQLADKVISGASLDSFGMSGKADKEAVYNRVAEKAKGLNLAGQQAAYKALSSAQTQTIRNQASVDTFEKTASKNLDMFLDLAKKVVDTGSPWINKPLREAEEGLLGNPDVPAYNAARTVAVNEIARIVNGGSLNGVMSQELRDEVSALSKPEATLKQIYSVMKTLKQDMANRKGSIDDEVTLLQKRIDSLAHSTTAPAAPQYSPGNPYNK